MENLNSCEFLEGLSCYQPFEHITCHLTTFRRPNWPIVSLLFMNGNGWREAAFIVYFSHDIDTWFVLSRYCPFANDDATIANLAQELPLYLAASDGVTVTCEDDKLTWWANHKDTLPHWSSLVIKNSC